eukprot:TRINITY_DN8727_c0_g1_i1.p1 TRINITY_DN8727_c0_g1~~TRINITY_DN8727_c0_g1_i1.p1  ORF type:complete len:682 (+),score=191.16 TRINITY_DN8727_c0_g1_i1:168-2048(+)
MPSFKTKLEINRPDLEDLLKRRFFFTPSFSIYGGVAGLYDYGPPGCAVKSNLTNYWRRHFVLEENMMEVECSNITPETVLKASGHVDKFQDLMVRDVVSKKCFRADHLLEEAMDKLSAVEGATQAQKDEYATVKIQADTYDNDELHAMLTKYEVKAPETGNDITEPLPFNLMFKTEIGPTGHSVGFLRPETAQGIFLNFDRLLEQNGGKLPFAGAQVGTAFRNEIAPRAGLLRVREFALAEIEHFVDPDNKKHPNFDAVKDVVLPLFPTSSQLNDGANAGPTNITVGEAVAKGTIDNETLAYFLARTFLFLKKIGMREDGIRFRQHLPKEMAHYATDCWDAEMLTTYGWIECVGHADRSCFDLNAHAKATNARLSVFEEFPEGPQVAQVTEAVPDKGKVGRAFKREGKLVMDHLAAMEQADVLQLQTCQGANADGTVKVEVDGKEYELTKDMLKFKEGEKKISGRRFTPSVVEPSFGIGRLLYCLLEHAHYVRDGARGVLKLSPIIAPVKCSVLPLMQQDKFTSAVKDVERLLTRAGISSKVDTSSTSIGRRYARTDEIGIPFGVTVDHITLEDQTVTLRERDSMGQVRVKVDEIPELVAQLSDMHITWADVLAQPEKYPPQTASE